MGTDDGEGDESRGYPVGGEGPGEGPPGDQLETEKQALILLKKLQDLKVWQSKQEERLIAEQGHQLETLHHLSVVQRAVLPANQNRGALLGRDEDDTTVSSMVFEEDASTYSDIESDNTWADRNQDRPTTKELNISAASVMTLTEDNQDLDGGQGGHLQDQIQDDDDEHPDIDDINDFSDETPSPPPNPEEMPVGGAGKSFTQLLNEKLGMEGEDEDYLTDDNQPVRSGGSGNGERKPFLKRGAGLTRFNLPADPSKQPSRIKRSKSQPRLASQDSKSRLIQETVSFAKKKAEPHRIHTSKSLNKLDDQGVSGTKISPGVKGAKRSPPAKLKLKNSPSHKRDENKTVKGKGRGTSRDTDSSPSGSPNRHSGCSPTPVTRSRSPRGNKVRISKSLSTSAVNNETAAGKLLTAGRHHDSVENSFREKLVVQEAKHEKELKELAVFEMLEDAANDTSFCSTSSRVKTLVDKSMLPSPARHKHLTASTPMNKVTAGVPVSVSSQPSTTFPASSTPKVYREGENTDLGETKDNHLTVEETDDDPSLGETLMEEIRKFVMSGPQDPHQLGLQLPRNRQPMSQRNTNAAAVPVIQDIEDVTQNSDDDSGQDDEESTIVEENDHEEPSIGKDWRARMMEWDKENLGEDVKCGARPGVIEYSPPSKLPKNSPSYLIWSIFTRDREERRLKALQKKQLSHEGKPTPTADNPKSAPPRLTSTTPSTTTTTKSPDQALFKQPTTTTAGNHPQANSKPASSLPLDKVPTEEDIAYQSTLLHMRVVELEQEIDTFKKENSKIINLKKKLTEEKQRLTKEWEEFEKMREEGKKKLDEERKRVRREKILLEKAQREMDVPKVCNECEGNLNKISKLQQDLSSKESKWNAALTKLQEQVSKVEKVNKNLQTENQRLRLKTVSSKIQSSIPGGTLKPETKVVPAHSSLAGSSATPSSDMTPDSGIRSAAPVDSGTNSGLESEDEYLDQELRKSIANTVYETLCADTPRMSYSPAESLESSVTLVSGLPSNTTDPASTSSHKNHSHQAMLNTEKGTKEKRWADGRLEVWYANGNRKEVSPDQKIVKVFYYNGDMKESHSSGLVKYLYSQTQTWHTTHPDGREVLQFSNGQEEVRFRDGSMEITFPDGSIKKIRVDGSEDIWFPDGTRVEVTVEGDRILYLANGQREEHTKDMKKRVYPDGTVKILYTDGRQETRYSNGRVRIKDPQGKLIKDTQPS